LRSEVFGPRRAFDFIDKLTGLTTAEAVIAAFQIEAGRFGYSTFALGELPRLGSQVIPAFFVSTWPAHWLDVYAGENLGPDDPTVAFARTGMIPDTFSGLRRRVAASGKSPRVLDIAAAHGWPEGLAIPVHGPNGYCGVVTVAGETEELAPTDRAALHLMALYLHERLKQLLAPGLTKPPAGSPRLTPGEIECIHWLIAGKTDWEMSEILGISEWTAHWRIEKAKAKFGVKTRAQLTALAVHHGYVKP
jgi:LuxR family transcriptional regulator, quorum-sensing system regulator BjaR1